MTNHGKGNEPIGSCLWANISYGIPRRIPLTTFLLPFPHDEALRHHFYATTMVNVDIIQ